MGYTAPATRATGQLITAAIWNTDIVENILHLASFKHAGNPLSSYLGGRGLGPYVGTYQYCMALTATLGGNEWVICDGRTIGAVGSGATIRAHADMQTLFNALWVLFANTQLPIQDSAGNASVRGGSSGADFAALKRMPLPDMRGRTPVGMDNNGSGGAGRITAGWASVLGGSGGVESVALSINEMPTHNHNAINGLLGAGTAGFVGGGAFAATALANQGGGAAHTNLQPSIACGNWYVYAGN